MTENETTLLEVLLYIFAAHGKCTKIDLTFSRIANSQEISKDQNYSVFIELNQNSRINLESHNLKKYQNIPQFYKLHNSVNE